MNIKSFITDKQKGLGNFPRPFYFYIVLLFIKASHLFFTKDISDKRATDTIIEADKLKINSNIIFIALLLSYTWLVTTNSFNYTLAHEKNIVNTF